MSAPPFRAVLLGASNLRLALPYLAGRSAAAGAREILVACGHGRSYGSWSSLMRFRKLPGILQCRLWARLGGTARWPTHALLTDIGNDVVYGVEVATIAGWVEECLSRFTAIDARIVITPLALGRIERLTPASYRFARTVLFPGRQLSWPALVERVRDLDGRIRQLARRYGATLVEQETAWYGFDPIHIRRGNRREAWQRILASWPEAPPETGQLRLPFLGVARYRLGSREISTPQPVLTLPGGGSVSLY